MWQDWKGRTYLPFQKYIWFQTDVSFDAFINYYFQVQNVIHSSEIISHANKICLLKCICSRQKRMSTNSFVIAHQLSTSFEISVRVCWNRSELRKTHTDSTSNIVTGASFKAYHYWILTDFHIPQFRQIWYLTPFKSPSSILYSFWTAVAHTMFFIRTT